MVLEKVKAILSEQFDVEEDSITCLLYTSVTHPLSLEGSMMTELIIVPH